MSKHVRCQHVDTGQMADIAVTGLPSAERRGWVPVTDDPPASREETDNDPTGDAGEMDNTDG